MSANKFVELATTSGLICNDKLKWVAFHSTFDFGYLVQMFLGAYGDDYPEDYKTFYNMCGKFFPNIYDLKHIIKDKSHLKDIGLAKLSNELNVKRIGPQHQAGSDSLITLACFFKLRDQIFKNDPTFENNVNVIVGIGKGANNKDYQSKQYWYNPSDEVQQYTYNNNTNFFTESFQYNNDINNIYNNGYPGSYNMPSATSNMFYMGDEKKFE